MTYQIEVSIMRTIEWDLRNGEEWTVHQALNEMLFTHVARRTMLGTASELFTLHVPIVKIEGTSFVVSIGNP